MNGSVRHLIFFALIGAMIYISYAYMIKPANENLAQQRSQMETKRSKLAELARETADSDDLNARLEELERTIQEIESKLPPSSEIHTVLENVTLIAQRHGLTPKTIRALAAKNNRGYIEQPLEMEVHGNFSSYYSFLLELERMGRLTKLRKMELKKKSREEGQTEAKFVMSIFFQNAQV